MGFKALKKVDKEEAKNKDNNYMFNNVVYQYIQILIQYNNKAKQHKKSVDKCSQVSTHSSRNILKRKN